MSNSTREHQTILKTASMETLEKNMEVYSPLQCTVKILKIRTPEKML